MVVVNKAIAKSLIYAISKSVFDPIYFIICYLTYIFYRRNINLNTHNKMKIEKISGIKAAESSLYGLVAGIIGSLMTRVLNIPMDIDIAYILLVPISIILSLINPRFTCFSYSAFILGIISLLIPSIKVSIMPMVILVAILHLIEGILIYITGYTDSTPMVLNIDNQYVGGYLMQKYWPIPMAIPIIGKGIIPMYGLLGYSSMAITSSPKEKAQKMGIVVIIYSIILLLGIKLTNIYNYNSVILIILMPLMHEVIYYLDKYMETKGELLYKESSDGIRILDVLNNSIAKQAGIQRGDIITHINNIKVEHSNQLDNLIKQGNNKLTISIIRLQGDKELIIIKRKKAFYDIGVLPLVKSSKVIYTNKNLLYNK